MGRAFFFWEVLSLNQLVDVDVDGVHLVGEPANRRRFAIVKGLAQPTPDGDLTVKTADFLEKIKARKDKGEEITPEIFVELFGKDVVLKALGTDAEALKKAADELAAAKKKAEAEKLDKSKLDDKTRAYVEGLEKKLNEQGTTLDEIVKAREAAVKVSLDKRVEVLKAAGFAPEGDSPTEAVIAALEIASTKFAKHVEEIGVLKLHGSDVVPAAGSAREAVAKSVREQLGREPVSQAEEAETRSKIYRANPGLLKSVLREERAAS